MPVSRRQTGDTVIYTLEGPLDRETVDRFFELNFADYYEVGDAIGAVVDFRQMERLTVAGLSAVQRHMAGVVFNTPVAFVGNPDSVLRAFLSGLDALSSMGGRRIRFFKGEEAAVTEAIAWLDDWFADNGIDRKAVRGQRTTAVPIPSDLKES